ncbi:endonuclease V-like isoform X4 [Cyprinus carpio]|uniref:Endonuclease V-like isoform X4 n=1 Tax=Cyprinus carpio TaxID=7962 RepID=A0A9R0AZC5_CYPCA|nr:endonuclease V-like isoform X4 [Cyprinus carpio]
MAAPEAELVLKWEREQARLRESVKEEDTEDWQRSPDFSGLKRVGGVDLSFIKGDDINACAHLVVLTYPHMKVLYEDCKMVTLNAPYVAGFLGFREAPPLLQALEKLKNVQPNLMPQGSSIGLEIGEWCRCCSLSIAPPGSVRSRGSRPHPTRHIYPHRPSQTGVYPRECSLLTLRGAVTVAMAYLGVRTRKGDGRTRRDERGGKRRKKILACCQH